jgi:hypothetical protein
VFLQFCLEALEQRESVCRPAGESRYDLAVMQAADLARIALQDSLPERYLAVAPHDHDAAASDAKDGSAVKLIQDPVPF